MDYDAEERVVDTAGNTVSDRADRACFYTQVPGVQEELSSRREYDNLQFPSTFWYCPWEQVTAPLSLCGCWMAETKIQANNLKIQSPLYLSLLFFF